MKTMRVGFMALIGLSCIDASSLCGAESAVRPVTPDAPPEAVELLNFF